MSQKHCSEISAICTRLDIQGTQRSTIPITESADGICRFWQTELTGKNRTKFCSQWSICFVGIWYGQDSSQLLSWTSTVSLCFYVNSTWVPHQVYVYSTITLTSILRPFHVSSTISSTTNPYQFHDNSTTLLYPLYSFYDCSRLIPPHFCVGSALVLRYLNVIRTSLQRDLDVVYFTTEQRYELMDT